MTKMTGKVSLSQAATFLGVSKGTLRIWDSSGKLRALRDPKNRYRVYEFSDLERIKARRHVGDESFSEVSSAPASSVRTVRGLISRLHKIIRDSDSHSNIIERFDELTKLLVVKFHSEENDPQFLYRRLFEVDSDYAERIRSAYALAVKSNELLVPDTFNAMLASDQALCEGATALAQISFRDVDFDIKGLAYEEVVRKTFDKNENQQFFTPPSIVEFMIEVMRPHLRGNICDPAAGTGGFLVEILKSGISHSSLTALEIDERLAWVTGINLFTHGARNLDVNWLPEGGTLGIEAERFFGKFDAIVTNPPFGSDFTDVDLVPRYQLGRGRLSRRRGVLFLERCHQLLKPKGALGFIIDEGVLNGSSTEDVRRFLTRHFHLEAIVSLPESAFMPYATVNASILILKKKISSQGKIGETLFAKADAVGRKNNGDDDFVYGKTGDSHLNSDLPRISELIRRFRESGQVTSSDFQYAANVAANFDGEDSGWRLDFRYHHPSRKLCRDQLSHAKGRLRGLSEICAERNETIIPTKELEGQIILYTGLAHIEAGTGIFHQVATPANSLKSAVKRYEPGDILFAKMRPNLRKVAFMDAEEGGYVSPECVVLAVRRGDDLPIIDPLLLSILLRSELVYGQIMHLISGIGRPRLSATDLRKVLIPIVGHAQQDRWRAQYLSKIDAAARIRNRASVLLSDAASLEKSAVDQLARKMA